MQCMNEESSRIQISIIESQRDAYRRDAERWRMHVKMMMRRHSPSSVRETIVAVDAAIAAKESQ